MPTYEYECAQCGRQFEKFQSIKAAPLKKCPHCDSRRVRRLLSTGGGLLFRGSGFYTTDYRSEGYKNAAKADVKPPETAKAPAADAGKKTTPKSDKAKVS